MIYTKNIIENNIGLNPPANGCIPISKVVAAVLGIAKINPPNPVNQLDPDITPKNGGNIRFPAPKNIANRAKPTTITSLLLFLFTI